MSKGDLVRFLADAASDNRIKDKFQAASSPQELVGVGREEGYDFEKQHLYETLSHLQERSGFFRAIAAAALHSFGPNEDNYPATGVQPFSGDIKASRNQEYFV